MATVFLPPGLNALSEIDGWGVPYSEKLEVIEGVVLPGQGGTFGASGDYMVHRIAFGAWCRLGGPVVEHELTLLRPVPLKQSYLDDYADFSIRQIGVFLSLDETRGVVQEERKAMEVNAELLSSAKSLRTPIEFATERWGKFKFNRACCTWDGSGRWDRKKVRISLRSQPGEVPDAAAVACESLWGEEKKWMVACRDKAAADLLPVKNSFWLQDGEAAMTESVFRNKIKLQSVSVGNDGTFQFWFECADLFAGHAIAIKGDLASGLAEAEIAG
ncbi:MAG: hypothetical protein JWP89_3015 [Schlesneria sp.]|nr:hypothetical protein [Schlesneria sp.]